MARLPLLLALLAVAACAPSAPLAPPPSVAEVEGVAYTMSAEEEVFLDTLQARTFRWFWETTPENGLTHDRYPSRDFSSVAAIGFALPAYGIGAERGFVTRAAAAERTLTTLRTLYTAPQGPEQVGTAGHRGYFYHFLEYDDATRFRNVELSTIDTALLMAGVLFSREYFDGTAEAEQDIRAYADSLYQRVEWPWFRKPGDTRLTMGWHPETDFLRADWRGYNEAMILYLLGLGSPTHPLDASVWPTWTSTYEWEDFYGYEHVNFTPLFGHQYSHMFVDFRGIQDQWMRDRSAEEGEPIDYFENSRRATLSQQAYAIDNPGGWADYSAEIWGLTASDGPSDAAVEVNGEERQFHTYWARGASTDHVNDDGTLTPTAAGGSIPFAPEITIPTLMAMAERYPALWTDDYGFRDAVNPTFTFEDVQIKRNSEVTPYGWVDHDYLGIDQGPILIMAENYRTGLVWETLKRSPYLVRGLQRAGFEGGWLDGARAEAVEALDLPPARVAEGPGADRLLVVVLGSSTAEGTGPTHRDSTWVNRFRTHLEGVDARFDVLNLARGGYATFHLMPTGTVAPDHIRNAPDPARNIDAALARNPDAIVINLPSNDAAYGVDAATQMANFDAMIAKANAAGVPVWITTTQPRDFSDPEQVAVQRAVRDQIRARYGDRAIDFWTGFEDTDGGQDADWGSGDNVHYNDAAHRVFFERVRDAGVAATVLAGN